MWHCNVNAPITLIVMTSVTLQEDNFLQLNTSDTVGPPQLLRG